MTLNLDITNIENNIYPCDLLIFYCDNNEINNFKREKLQLSNYILNKSDFKNLLSKFQIDEYYPKYILEFYIDNQLNDIIDYDFDYDFDYDYDNGNGNDNDNDNIYKYKLNTVKDIDDIIFTNTHFLNTLIIILDKKHKQKRYINSYNCTQNNRNIKNTTKKIRILQNK